MADGITSQRNGTHKSRPSSHNDESYLTINNQQLQLFQMNTTELHNMPSHHPITTTGVIS